MQKLLPPLTPSWEDIHGQMQLSRQYNVTILNLLWRDIRHSKTWTENWNQYWDTASSLEKALEADATTIPSIWTPGERLIFRTALQIVHRCNKIAVAILGFLGLGVVPLALAHWFLK